MQESQAVKRTKELQQQVDWLTGHVAALGIAVHALLKTHPNKQAAADLIHADLERQLAAALPSSLPDEVQHGIEAARDMYLLKGREDPGQPPKR